MTSSHRRGEWACWCTRFGIGDPNSSGASLTFRSVRSCWRRRRRKQLMPRLCIRSRRRPAQAYIIREPATRQLRRAARTSVSSCASITIGFSPRPERRRICSLRVDFPANRSGRSVRKRYRSRPGSTPRSPAEHDRIFERNGVRTRDPDPHRFRNFISAKSPTSWKPEKAALSTRIRRKCASSSRTKWTNRADDIAARRTRIRGAVLADGTPHCLDPSRLHLRDSLATGRRARRADDAGSGCSRHPRANRRTPSLPSAILDFDSCGSSAIGRHQRRPRLFPPTDARARADS